LPVGTTGNVVESFTTDYLVVAGGGGGGQGYYGGGGGAGGLRTSYNNSTTTTNTLSFPSGKTAIATYMLDNNATDISGNYNGTETNISYNTGQYGGAAVFNGSNSAIVLPNNILTSNFSVSAWFYLNSTSGNQYLFEFDYENRVIFRISSTDNNWAYIGNSGYFNPGITYTPGRWYNVVITFSNGNPFKIYINGVLSYTGGNTNVSAFNNDNILGAANSSGSGAINGLIDQVRIYDSALSATDVSNIYNNEVQALSGGGTAAESSLTLTAGVAYNVTVGSGAIGGNTQSGTADDGNNSIFSTITSNGGGGGQNRAGSFGSNGGSGGGGALNSSAGGNGTLNQGYAGGSLSAAKYGAGGGGASEIGLIPLTDYNTSPQRNSLGAPGGDGLSVSITGTATYYAGGGGGGARNPGPDAGTSGGLGGGGNGGKFAIGEDGSNNTGGGGGGGGDDGDNGGNGGSGVVILRYPTASVSSFTTTGTLNTPSTTDTLADNNYPATTTAYYTLDGNANGYLTTNDLGTFNYPSGAGCIALYELNGNANGYLTTTDLSTVNYPAGVGCIALYELNGNAADTSNTYNGSATDVTYNTGAFDQAAVFNGSSSYIATPTLLPTNNFSFSCWISPSSFASSANKVIYNQNITNNRFYISIYDSGKIEVWNGANTFTTSSSVVNLNQWHNIVYTASSSTGKKIYVDGIEVLTNADTGNNQGTATGTNWVGFGKWYTNILYLDGKLDQVRIFDTAISAANVTTLARGAGSAYSGAETNITYNTGAFDQAAVFNGSNSKISLGNQTIFNSGDYSVSFWLKNQGNDSSYQILFSQRTNSDAGSPINISLYGVSYSSNAGKLYLAVGGSYFVSNTALSKNRWYHLVFTVVAGGAMKIYINGALDSNSSTETTTRPTPTNQNLAIGANGSNADYPLNGALDQIRIFNSALTQSQVTTLARGAGTAYNGAESNITWQNGRFNKAAVFNGSNSYISGTVGATATTSFSMWVKINDPSTSSTEFIQVFDNNNFAIFIYSGKLNIQYASGSNSNGVAWTISNASNWNHIAGTFTSGSSTLYVNGVQKTESMNNWVNAESVPHIGNRNALDGYFNGEIDQIRIFSTALTLSNVTDLYNEHYQTKFTDGSNTAIVFTEGTGTLTFSGVNPAPPQGVLRTNTSYSEDGSASVIEHYNGTNWKYFDAIKYCTTNTLNFPLGAGCIASYNLDNNVNDIGNTYNGINNNVTFTASGKFGVAGVFNGSSSNISVTGSLINSLTSISYSAWVYYRGTGSGQSYGHIVSGGATNSTAAGTGLGMAVQNSNDILYIFAPGGSSFSTTTLPENVWTHLAVTNSGSTAKLYMNGSLVHTASIASLAFNSSSNTFRIGEYYYNGSHHFYGEIDQVRIFNTAISSTQVEDLYNSEIACS